MHDAQMTLCVHVDRAKVSDTVFVGNWYRFLLPQYVDMDMYEVMCVYMLLCMIKYRPH